MSSIITNHLVSDEEIQLPTYKKLPPIQGPQKMSGRQVISPTSISVDFSPPSSVQSKQLVGSKVTVRKTSAESTKLDSGKSLNQSIGNKRANVLGSGGKLSNRSSGDVPIGQTTNGIELIGYKMINSQAVSPGDKSVVSQQTSDWTPLSSELPPCRICGDRASGLHYGVNTCEACKAFFRRTLKKSTVNFQCTCTPEEKQLGTDQPRKTTCAKCRYEMCLKTGMSKDAIKIGRYTISRKRQNDHEVKTLKKGEINDGVRRISESSKSTASGSPYSTSQSVSSPEELSSDITSLSLKEKKVTQRAKKRRHDDEDGLLYQSLTNSIFMSLLNNKEETLQMSENSPPSTSDQQVPTGTTPMEQLLISNDRDTAVPKADSETDYYEPELEEFSPMATILSTYNEALIEDSPATDGDTYDPFQFSPSLNQTVEMPNTGSELVANHLPNGEMPSGTSAVVADNLPNNDDINPSLYGINDGKEINVQGEGNGLGTNPVVTEESPIENLLTAPTKGKPYSTILTVTYDNMLSNLTSNTNMTQTVNGTVHDVNMYNGIAQNAQVSHGNYLPGTHVNGYHQAKLQSDVIQGSQVFSAYKPNEIVQHAGDECDFLNNEFEDEGFDAGEFIENLDEIEVQTMQLYRFENPAIVVGNGITVKEAAELILKIGQAAVVLFDNTKKMTCEEIKKRHADYLEQYTLKNELFGDMTNISKEEYLEFYNQTGIDIDNRQQILIEALKYMEESIAKLVKFAKAIPGFSDLDIDDQVNLLKASLVEYSMVKPGNSVTCKVSDIDVATMPWGQEYHLKELVKFFPEELFELKKEIYGELDEIDLSEEEVVVLRAVVVTALVSRFEFEMIKLQRGMGCRKSVYQVTTTPWDKEYHIEEILKLFPLEYIKQKLAKANEFLRHGLSPEELLIFKAIVLTFPASRYEHDMVQFGQVGKCVRSSMNVATLPWNKEYHIDEINKIFPQAYCSTKLDNLQNMIKLGLSFEETVILKALIITFPDRCELKEREKVENLHNRLIACFLFMLGTRPADKVVTVQSVLRTLFKIRELAVWDNQIIQEMFEVWPVTSNHQLVKEFVT